ncbi:carbamoyltransferase C-terminal domain-containing protein [Streptomyces tirandamycinicus]|uniref:carbamoyltransferase C-terminal domain-containing protein n=1 Tax=Streptomyces tirandamycinicus TaxID=2174846 RepID=UPI0022721470|nr:carbamoyltransferase C-terminal domain-containing protein [Streptomyces tirandamycinicus]MCY0982112.1 carbamoyltransferase [Streptomyces tirandamycinicus]
MWILGVNAPPTGWHDTSACLVNGDGEIVAFSEEERINRRRHSLYRKPVNAARFCLEQAGITASDIDVVAVGWDGEQLYPRRFADDADFLAHAVGLDFGARTPEVVRVPHHQAHAASSFYASPFPKAGVLVIDGHGENESSSIWTYEEGAPPRLERSWQRTSSLGYAYDAASTWLGFSFLNAGKTMGLAAYGRAAGLEAEPLVDIQGDDFRLAVAPLAENTGRATAEEIKEQYETVVGRWRERYTAIAGTDAPSLPEGRLAEDPKAVLVAYTAQRVIEEAVTHLASLTRKAAGVEALCLSGGVALNCSTNGTLPGPLYVPPVPHDAGVALGAAWTVSPPGRRTGTLSPYLGTDIHGSGPAGPGEPVDTSGLLPSPLDIDEVTELLLGGAVGAVAQGRAEVGPRALCHRSIIAVPDTAGVNTRVNTIKNREQWRPFAGVTRPAYGVRLWEQQEYLSLYMLGAARATELGRAVAPGVVHVDGTTRPQVLHGDEAPAVGAVLDTLEAKGAPPVLLNTSFNDRGEPIVNTARDAVAAFRSMELDFLVLGDELYRKADGPGGAR